MKKNKKLRFRLDIQYDEYRAYYQGNASKIRLFSEEGVSLIFPASRLSPFLMHDGIHGRFEIVFDDQNKFIRLTRLT